MAPQIDPKAINVVNSWKLKDDRHKGIRMHTPTTRSNYDIMRFVNEIRWLTHCSLAYTCYWIAYTWAPILVPNTIVLGTNSGHPPLLIEQVRYKLLNAYDNSLTVILWSIAVLQTLAIALQTLGPNTGHQQWTPTHPPHPTWGLEIKASMSEKRGPASFGYRRLFY